MKKICVITGTRAEYGLLYPLIKGISEDDELYLQLVVTGMHLLPEFGNTYKQIEEDGFKIDKKVELPLSLDTSIGISKSIGSGIVSFSEVFNELNPDLILVLGDRTEIFSVASAALIVNIPIAHLHGGEVTEGAYDDAIRHSITKMSHLHFASTEVYRNRIIQLGENPDLVFNYGALGIENIKNTELLSFENLKDSLGIDLNANFFLITFHPVTLESGTAEEQIKELFAALDQYKDVSMVFTKPNSDKDGRIISKLIDEYAEKLENVHSFKSLGLLRYLSAMKYAKLVIGNSSSGIIEAPSMHTPTINIGDRQLGRIMSNSIINCQPNKDSIKQAISKGLSQDFIESIQQIDCPYGDGDTSRKIIEALKKIDFSSLIKKRFFDLN